MQLWIYMDIRFPNLSECHRQIPFLESMSLPHVLCQLVLIKENKTKMLLAQKVALVEPSKQLKQIFQIEYNIVHHKNYSFLDCDCDWFKKAPIFH